MSIDVEVVLSIDAEVVLSIDVEDVVSIDAEVESPVPALCTLFSSPYP